MNRSPLLLLAGIFLAACGPRELEPDAALECSNCERWNAPQEPFRVYGDTWYVGTAGLSSLLIETEAGLILVGGALPQSAALIVANIRKLGFDPMNIKVILLSHAHFDHAGGIAAIQRLTGAAVHASTEAAKALSSGTLQSNDPQFRFGPENTGFPASGNVNAIADGEFVSIGGVDVRAVYTPGHTPGGTSWAWESCALGTCYDVVYADSLSAVSAEGFHFSASAAAKQLIESAGVLSELDCDILLSPHPFFFGMQDKLERRDEGNPFVNNVACMIYAETGLDWLERRLDSERRPVLDDQ